MGFSCYNSPLINYVVLRINKNISQNNKFILKGRKNTDIIVMKPQYFINTFRISTLVNNKECREVGNMVKKVQGIIVRDNKFLTVEGVNSYGRRENFFLYGHVKENESETEAIKRELMEQLNLEHEITLRFSKEIDKDKITFFIDIKDSDLKIDVDLDKVKCSNSYYRASGIRWVSLEDTKILGALERQYAKLLIEEITKTPYGTGIIELIREQGTESLYLRNLYRQYNRLQVDTRETITSKLKIILIALGLGVLFDYFFIWDSIGVSALIYSGAILIGSIYGLSKDIKLKRRQGYFLLVPITLLSLTFTIYNNLELRALNVIVVPFLIVAYLLIIRYEDIKEINGALVLNILDRVFPNIYDTITKYVAFIKEIIGKKKNFKENSTQKSVVTGLLISIPLLLIVIMLLTSADMMFRYYLERVGSIFHGLNTASIIGHSVVIVIVSLYMFGLIWSFKYSELNRRTIKIELCKASWEPLTIVTVLTVINIAYLLFTIIQFAYLYGGGFNALPQGYSYAEYARKGFFEVILVTCINLAIVILGRYLTKNSSEKINKIANGSYSLLIAFTFNMLFSASYKMNLYQQAFGYTKLRIFVQAFILFVGILLVIMLLSIWMKRIPVFKCIVISATIIYLALNFINIDRIIARENIYRYQQTNQIDLWYLSTLSCDAAPELVKLLDSSDSNIIQEINYILSIQREQLSREYNKWYEFNYYKSKLMKMK